MLVRFLILSTLIISSIFANEVMIVDVKARCTPNKLCTFFVTLKHKDTGWEHYANKWTIGTEDGKLLGSRTLHHPHVNEQPFTRSLSRVKIPEGIKKVYIKAYDSVHKESKDIFEYTIN